MRRALLLAVAAASLGVSAGPASAYCDPKYQPLCANDCTMRPPSLKDPLEYVGRTCPD